MSLNESRESTTINPSLTPSHLLRSWLRILAGSSPMLSIEITRECPLRCPGCYAYGENHLGGEKVLRELRDLSGDDLVKGVIGLVRRHRPLQVSLVGGEPMIRHRELSRLLPVLSGMGIFTMVVTSGVIPIPLEWMKIPRFRAAVSVDGLPEHHDERRKPATYERILRNISGRSVNVHWVITHPMLERPKYLEEYVSFWNARSEVEHIWVSLYTPQQGEDSRERLTREDREFVSGELARIRKTYPKLLAPPGMMRAFVNPPESPEKCLFAKMSVNYSADLATQVEPCVFGGKPDCSQCGCGISSALHWIQDVKVAGPVRIGHLARLSLKAGTTMGKLRRDSIVPRRWREPARPLEPQAPDPPLNGDLPLDEIDAELSDARPEVLR
ncbi:MAG: radical SAM protein [Acidobacteria bacterium]|nr:radical SAM protein [Acidobacteriota bacterium]